MPNVAAAGGRPAENGATPGSESLYLWKSTIGAAAAQPRRRCLRRRRLRGKLLGARPLRVSSRRRRLGRLLRPLLRAQGGYSGGDAAGERWRSEHAK